MAVVGAALVTFGLAALLLVDTPRRVGTRLRHVMATPSSPWSPAPVSGAARGIGRRLVQRSGRWLTGR